MMFKKLKIFCLSIFVLAITVSLTGCKPPPSGEAAGIRYPILFIQLQQMELPVQLAMPVEKIKPRQIQDTWGTARSGGRKHEGIDIFAKRGTPVLSATQGIVVPYSENGKKSAAPSSIACCTRSSTFFSAMIEACIFRELSKYAESFSSKYDLEMTISP